MRGSRAGKEREVGPNGDTDGLEGTDSLWAYTGGLLEWEATDRDDRAREEAMEDFSWSREKKTEITVG